MEKDKGKDKGTVLLSKLKRDIPPAPELDSKSAVCPLTLDEKTFKCPSISFPVPKEAPPSQDTGLYTHP